MKISENVLIAELTTMRLGGQAQFVAEIENVEDVKAGYLFAREQGLPTYILGDGANVIGRDEGFAGVILLNKIMGVEILEETAEELVLEAMGGEEWDEVVRLVCNKGFSGIEAMSAIPGTAGAAPVQNIGAYGQEIAQVLESVEAFDSLTNEFVTIKKSAMNLGYRRSIFNFGEQAGRYFIVSIKMRLKKTELKPPFYTSLQKYIEEHGETDFSPANIRRMVREIRAMKLPDPAEEASAGSFFKNVYLSDAEADEAEQKGIQVWRNNGENKVNAGWLIEQAGLNGQRFNGFLVSDKAALILINESAKSYADLAAARAKIVQVVQEKFGFVLEQEPVELK